MHCLYQAEQCFTVSYHSLHRDKQFTVRIRVLLFAVAKHRNELELGQIFTRGGILSDELQCMFFLTIICLNKAEQ
jgi:hypothetical protein